VALLVPQEYQLHFSLLRVSGELLVLQVMQVTQALLVMMVIMDLVDQVVLQEILEHLVMMGIMVLAVQGETQAILDHLVMMVTMDQAEMLARAEMLVLEVLEERPVTQALLVMMVIMV
jgi:hypothetical protein